MSTVRMQVMVQRAKRTVLGRLLCRLAGDKTGAVMMEYVILAVLIAAAAVVAVAMFGRTIVGMFDTAGKGATADHTGARQAQEATRAQQDADAQAARDYHDSMHQ